MKCFQRAGHDSSFRRYLLFYTLAFAILALILYFPYLRNGNSLIWKPDGLTQYYNALVYYGNWLRSAWNTLLTEHTLAFPTYDFFIGYGSDILTTLHYYVIGDPLNLLAALVPVASIEYLYDALIVLRLYLAGLAFSWYLFGRAAETPSAPQALAGTLSYVFCGYTLILGTMQPIFVNPLIYLPLLLLGVERVLAGKRGHLLVFAAALSAVSNFYFFYMLVILTVLYCVVRFLTMKHKNWGRELLIFAGRTTGFSLAGTLIAGALLLPMILAFLSDLRSQNSLPYAQLYTPDYYENLFEAFITAGTSSTWTYLGFTSFTLLCVFVIFLKRKRFLFLKASFLLFVGMLLFPAAGSFMNGFSYPANRWCFGLVFLAALITAEAWQELFTLSFRERMCLLLLSLGYLFLLLWLKNAGGERVFFSMAVMLLALVLISNVGTAPAGSPAFRFWFPQKALLLLLCAGIAGNGLMFYDTTGYYDYMSRFVASGEGLSTLDNTASRMMSIFLYDEDQFFRCMQDPLPQRNDNLNYKVYSTQYYWSLSNGSITQFFNELAMPFTERLFKYNGLDYRSGLQALAGVRYYVRHDPNDYLPWPFTDSEVIDCMDERYYASETDLYLPFGYTYDSYISRETYESLSYPERQQALLQGAVCVENGISGSYPETALEFEDVSVPYTVSYDPKKILETEGGYYALEDGAVLTLTFEGIPQSETYLLLEGIQAEAVSALEFYMESPTAEIFAEEWEEMSDYEKRTIREDDYYYTDPSSYDFICESNVKETEFTYYTALTESSYDRSDYLLNLGYSESGQTQITVALSRRGVYSFENLEVVCMPTGSLAGRLEALQEDVLENVSFGTNSVSGTISLEEDKLLCVSLPYSQGWTAYVDGEPSEILQANTMYMALALEAGEHTIEFKYETPGLKQGLALTGTGLAAWALYGAAGLWLGKRRKKEKQI